MRTGKFIHFILAAFFLFGFLSVQCSNSYEFSEESAAEILKSLSSDEMRGRRAFTPDIESAADFIANEFGKAGLISLPDLKNYRQSFSLLEVNVGSAAISADDNAIPDDHFFALLNGEDINWDQNNVTTSAINKDDNFRAKFRELRSKGNNLLVFVDPSFSDHFKRYRAYFTKQNRNHNNQESANIVFVLNKPSNSFSIKIDPVIKEKKLANVVGMIEGHRSDEYVLFSAHYDHLGIRTPVEGDSIANGANDNASGVTAVIELAKYFKSTGKPERTLIFATFTAEEIGGYGSQYFSKQLNPDEIVAMFNIEMIGKPAVSGPNTAWITGYKRSDFGELLSKSAEGTIYEFYPDPYPQQNLFYRSDNATLARLGVPAHTISTTPIDVDTDYHQVSDEFETINISHLTNTIKAIAKAAHGIVAGEDTPTRIDTELVD